MQTKEEKARRANERYHALTPEQKTVRNSSPGMRAAKARYRSNPDNRRKEYKQNRAWLAKDGNSNWKQFQKRLTTYNLALDQYHAMAENQDFLCASCGEEPLPKTRLSSIDNFVIDHNHKTGKVRGLLCNHCNTAIGYLRECSIRALAVTRYITRHSSGDELCVS